MWFNELEEGSKHLCWMGAPKPPRFYRRLLFFDVESQLRKNNLHHVNSVGVTWEVRPGVFSEVLFFADEMQHPEDGVVKHEVYEFQYWPERIDITKVKYKKKPDSFRPFYPLKRQGHSTSVRRNNDAHWEEEEEEEGGGDGPSRRRRRRISSLARQFISSEAAVADEDEEDEEEEEEEESDDQLDAVEREERRQRQRRRRRRVLDSDDDSDDENSGVEEVDSEEEEEREEERLLESSALDKFISFFVNESQYGTVWIAHCSGR